jgi:hypothetical protein
MIEYIVEPLIDIINTENLNNENLNTEEPLIDISDVNNKCKYCLDDKQYPSNKIITPCSCVQGVHENCLKIWKVHHQKSTCEICLSKYQIFEYQRNECPCQICNPKNTHDDKIITLITFSKLFIIYVFYYSMVIYD